MSTKTALIVDDSKTAQFKLKRILQPYDLTVDLAFSAEDALSYLSYRIPDIIFMDHSMRGMNGIEAVKIIKSNPATAIIPVAMYTAESGEEYITKARAAGAINVLSKDVMTEADVDRVMKSINISSAHSDAPSIKHADDAQPSAPSGEVDLSPALAAVRDQVAGSMDIQQRRVRREIADNTRVLINRFMREFRVVRDDFARHQKQQQEANGRILKALQPTKVAPKHGWMLAFFALLTAIALFSVFEVVSLKKQVRALQTNSSQGNHTDNALGKHAGDDGLDEGSHTQAAHMQNATDKLIASFNSQNQFEFSEQALAGSRSAAIKELLDSLAQQNFRGTLSLEVHHGNFCVELGDNGVFGLPSRSKPMPECQLMSETAQSFTSSTSTSIQFANMINSAEIVERGDLRIDVIALGVSAPTKQYPQLSEATNSDQWNAVAATNNRVVASLFPRD